MLVGKTEAEIACGCFVAGRVNAASTRLGFREIHGGGKWQPSKLCSKHLIYCGAITAYDCVRLLICLLRSQNSTGLRDTASLHLCT